jgi:DHA1 family tetracycline resistance protein-like MFS transporter
VIFTQTFALAIGRFRAAGLPGAPYLLASILVVAALALAVRVARPPAPPVG